MPDALKELARIPARQKSDLTLAAEVAKHIPTAHLDPRCYDHKPWQKKNGQWLTEIQLDSEAHPVIRKAGWAWSAHYQLLAHGLDARRQTRDFHAWQVNQQVHKDHFSGKEEVVADSR